MPHKKNQSDKLLDVFKKEKTQKILNYWRNKPRKWIQSCKLRKEFVKKYSNVKLHPYGFYVDPVTREKHSSKPKPLYNEDSDFYRDLRELVDLKILENKKSQAERGMPKSYYRPCKKYEKEIIRIQNKECIDFFPRDKIMVFPSNICRNHIIYGLSDELLNNIFSQDDKVMIEKSLEKIDMFLDEIYKIKVKRIFAEWDRRIDIFLKITKSKNIKNLLRDKGNRGNFRGLLFNQIALNLYSSDIDICSSKTLFFFAFGIFIKRKSNPHQRISIRMEINNAMHKIINSKSKKLFNENLKEFCKIWSLTFFNEDYNLLLSDIKELIQFGWDNKDFFKLCIPIEIAYSRSNIYDDKISM